MLLSTRMIVCIIICIMIGVGVAIQTSNPLQGSFIASIAIVLLFTARRTIKDFIDIINDND